MNDQDGALSPDLIRAAFEAGLAAPSPGAELSARLGVLLQDTHHVSPASDAA